MKLKLTILAFFIFISVNTFSQENSEIILGQIISPNQVVGNVHIINLTTKQGTISNKNGEFEIFVTENDELLFSSIQFNHLKITVTKSILTTGKISVSLTPIVNELDEVFLNGLTGSLDLDFKKTPKDTIPKPNFVYKLSDLKRKLPWDEYGPSGHVSAETFTNPLYLRGGGQGTPYNKQLEKERAVKRDIKRKTEFPSKLKRELGIGFFIKDLKIPEEKINNFISYCEYQDIITKYHSNRVLEVIEILKIESKTYNEIK